MHATVLQGRTNVSALLGVFTAVLMIPLLLGVASVQPDFAVDSSQRVPPTAQPLDAGTTESESTLPSWRTASVHSASHRHSVVHAQPTARSLAAITDPSLGTHSEQPESSGPAQEENQLLFDASQFDTTVSIDTSGNTSIANLGVTAQLQVVTPTDNSVATEYTWQDGAHERRVTLVPDLVAQPSAKNSEADNVVRAGLDESIVKQAAWHQEQATHPVFRFESGALATLPGGVVLVLDATWTQADVAQFFASQGIAPDSVRNLAIATNAFLIDTEPGFPSLELANALAGLNGVVISSPDWSTEIEFY